jgi:hypothetical protein
MFFPSHFFIGGETCREICALSCMEEARSIGASHHTIPAAKALIRINEDYSIFPLGAGTGWANIHTGRFSTMHTE